ncbi:MAG: beta-galactosidase [Kiritimatiellae bacterium]|nr:beta-galactosidase [Kiritimatiellia bacterium]
MKWFRFFTAFALFGMTLPRVHAEVDWADESLASEVKWICPNEEFATAIGKTRYYRTSFETREGLVRATGRWWIDDVGSVFLDGHKIGGSVAVENPVTLTAALKGRGRHVLAVEGRNLAGVGGVCLSIELQYADGKSDSVFTTAEWRCAKEVPAEWATPGFDDSGWEKVKIYDDVYSPPWINLRDMSLLAPFPERQRRAAIRAALDRRVAKAMESLAKEEKPLCKIAYENGKPYFDIGGKRYETTFYNCSEGWNGDNRKLRRQTAFFRDAGVHLYGIGVQTPSVWKADGSIDFDNAIQKIRSVLSIDPEARFQFCIDTSSPPPWWSQKHPDEVIGYANGKADPAVGIQIQNIVAPSLASTLWRREAGDYITRLVRFLESSPYASRIYAYRPDYGIHHEWHYYGMTGYMPDNGKAMTAAFRRWLERNYNGDVEALRRAWNRVSVTFATAEVPSREERLRTSAGSLRDPVKDRPTIDYLRCHSEQVRDCLFAFNRAAKEACCGRALVGNYCGYFFGMPFPAEGFHLENDAILDSPWVDFQCSPYVYGPGSRDAGNVQYARCLLEGLRRRGKLALLEADNVTTLFKESHAHGNYTRSREDDLAILARDFAQTLCWGCGYWYFDFGIGWYDAPEFREFFQKIYAIRREVTDCRSVSEVLVVGDYESVMLTNAGDSRFNDARTTDLVNALGHTGVPFDSASIVDLASGKLKDYQVYIFCNLHYRTPAKEKAVESLRAKGKVVLIPEQPLSAETLRELFVKNDVHIWNADPQSAIYASVSSVALHCALPGEKTIQLPRRAKVTMLYPEHRELAADTDRILFTPRTNGMSTTLFRTEYR